MTWQYRKLNSGVANVSFKNGMAIIRYLKQNISFQINERIFWNEYKRGLWVKVN